MQSSSDSDVQQQLEHIDAFAFLVLRDWGTGLNMSPDSADCYHLMKEKSAAAPFLVTKEKVLRLRLVARVEKILKLLSCSPGPGPNFVASVRAWIVGMTGEVTEDAALEALEGLLTVRDVGLAEGSVSAASACPSGDVSTLVSSLLHAVQQLNKVLPQLCGEDRLSQIESQLLSRKSDLGDSQLTQPAEVVHIDDSPPVALSLEPTATVKDSNDKCARQLRHEADPVVRALKRRRKETRSKDGPAMGDSQSTDSQDPVQTASERPAETAQDDIFFMPLHPSEEGHSGTDKQDIVPAEHHAASVPPPKRIRSAADDESEIVRGDIPKKPRSYTPWTEEEEQRLREGYNKYGKSWSMIQKTFNLRHRTPVQLKDKWRNLTQPNQK